MRHVAIDGDFFGQFMLSGSGRAMMRFIGAEHVGNGQSPPGWRENGCLRQADTIPGHDRPLGALMEGRFRQ
jgi:hypothetical protein